MGEKGGWLSQTTGIIDLNELSKIAISFFWWSTYKNFSKEVASKEVEDSGPRIVRISHSVEKYRPEKRE